MKIIKNIILRLIVLIVMIFIGIIILKIFNGILKLGYENIWISGLKVGFVAWIILLMKEYYKYIKNKNKDK